MTCPTNTCLFIQLNHISLYYIVVLFDTMGYIWPAKRAKGQPFMLLNFMIIVEKVELHFVHYFAPLSGQAFSELCVAGSVRQSVSQNPPPLYCRLLNPAKDVSPQLSAPLQCCVANDRGYIDSYMLVR